MALCWEEKEKSQSILSLFLRLLLAGQDHGNNKNDLQRKQEQSDQNVQHYLPVSSSGAPTSRKD
jgi:hypothetical protein